MIKRVVFYNLEAEMLRAKLIRAELAAMINKSVSSINSKFNGKTEFTLGEMEKIKGKLEEFNKQTYTLDYLFERENKAIRK